MVVLLMTMQYTKGSPLHITTLWPLGQPTADSINGPRNRLPRWCQHKAKTTRQAKGLVSLGKKGESRA